MRQQNVWMGRDNEFRTYRRFEAATVSKSTANAKGMGAQAGAELRQHNFKFGFDDPSALAKDQALKSEVAKQSLYDYTKSSQADISDWRKKQEIKNRVSNIQWGLKPLPASVNRYGSTPGNAAEDPMNRTFSSNLKPHPDNFKETKGMDSSRTAKNHSYTINVNATRP